jgi:hypothetical protein
LHPPRLQGRAVDVHGPQDFLRRRCRARVPRQLAEHRQDRDRPARSRSPGDLSGKAARIKEREYQAEDAAPAAETTVEAQSGDNTEAPAAGAETKTKKRKERKAKK